MKPRAIHYWVLQFQAWSMQTGLVAIRSQPLSWDDLTLSERSKYWRYKRLFPESENPRFYAGFLFWGLLALGLFFALLSFGVLAGPSLGAKSSKPVPASVGWAYATFAFALLVAAAVRYTQRTRTWKGRLHPNSQKRA